MNKLKIIKIIMIITIITVKILIKLCCVHETYKRCAP